MILIRLTHFHMRGGAPFRAALARAWRTLRRTA
jgi:hypothetical protein